MANLGRTNLGWILLGLALMSVSACSSMSDYVGQWGGPPSAGPGSPYQVHHQGDPP
jgi:hypothetical protein